MLKPTALGIALISMALSASAQITVTSSQMPKANDTFRYVTAAAVNYSSLTSITGANRFWVFPQASSPVTQLDEYKSSLKTPYAFYFFNTVGKLVSENVGLGQFQLEDVYQFYSSNATSYRIEGIGFKISLVPAPMAGNYQQEDVVFRFPLEYQDRDSTPFRVKVSLPLVGAYQQSGYRITEVLGYGKVVVVTDTLECLMVRSDIIGSDTIETQFTKFGFPSHRVEYRWLSLEHHSPVAEITGTEVGGMFVPAQARYLNLEPKQSGGGGGGGGGGSTAVEGPHSFSQLCYPNPTQNRLNLHESVESVEVYALDGRQMEFTRTGEGIRFDWPSGVYFIKLITADGSKSVQKVLVR